MTKLLSEQELREKLIPIFKKYNPLYPSRCEEAVGEALDLIHSQKIAHGEMVIGVDAQYSSADPIKNVEVSITNQLRAEQKGRNV